MRGETKKFMENILQLTSSATPASLSRVKLVSDVKFRCSFQGSTYFWWSQLIFFSSLSQIYYVHVCIHFFCSALLFFTSLCGITFHFHSNAQCVSWTTKKQKFSRAWKHFWECYAFLLLFLSLSLSFSITVYLPFQSLSPPKAHQNAFDWKENDIP